MKNVKKNAMFVKLFWYKVFPHWKLKLLSFLVDSVLSFPYHTLFVFWTFFCFLSESIDCERKSLDFEANAVMYIHKYIHSYIQKYQMKLASGTGNPGWSHTWPELVCCEAWWLVKRDAKFEIRSVKLIPFVKRR